MNQQELLAHSERLRVTRGWKGWCSVEEARILYGIVRTNDIRLAYECGTRRGWSACWMVLGGAYVHTWDVETFEPEQTVEYGTSFQKLVDRHIGFFHENVGPVIAQRGKGPILVYIDGDHLYESVKKDFEAVKPYFKTGDFVVFNDTKSWKNVKAYIETEINSDKAYKTTWLDTYYGTAIVEVL